MPKSSGLCGVSALWGYCTDVDSTPLKQHFGGCWAERGTKSSHGLTIDSVKFMYTKTERVYIVLSLSIVYTRVK